MKKMVSFIIIAYNEESNIYTCVNAILNQFGDHIIEIIVVNDGSKDHTSRIIKKISERFPLITLINNPYNLGRGASRSIGIKKSNGEYIAFVDADVLIPQDWLSICLENISNVDAVGGIAIPDGDVQYIYNKYNLEPKKTNHTTEITGSNGLFKKYIFKHLNFDRSMKEGEDVDLIWRLKKAKYKVKCITSLICKHKENKNYLDSIYWLYRSGIGATKLLILFKKIRLPDLIFFVFLLQIFLFAALIYYTHNIVYIVIPVFYLYIVSAIHLNQKFYLAVNLAVVLATLTNTTLIFSYMIGRIVGYIKYFPRKYIMRPNKKKMI